MMAAVLNNNDPDNEEDIFVYMGGDMIVPRDVVRCRVHPSVTVITAMAFFNCMKLEEIELCEGILEIEEYAFGACMRLKRVNIPSTVTVIHDQAFSCCVMMKEVELCEGLLEIRDEAFDGCIGLENITFPSTLKSIGNRAFDHAFNALISFTPFSLPNGIERLGDKAFHSGKLTHFRIPQLITTVPENVVSSSECMVSVDLSENITEIGHYAFSDCYSLRNVAIPTNALVWGTAFWGCKDLLKLFGTYAQIINALKHRFDNLPIHKMLYYQSYDNVTSDQLNNATNMRSGQSRSLRTKLDPIGKQHDCLGMTPLHILACSTVQNLELYRVLIEKYPENLVVEDKWGASPLFYALLGNAPNEVLQLLADSYRALYPCYDLKWTEMLETLGKVSSPLYVFQKLLDLQQASFSQQNIEWDSLLGDNLLHTMPPMQFRLIVLRSIKQRINAIGVKQWRDVILGYKEIDNSTFLPTIRSKLANYEAEYHKLKEATSVLELVLWKKQINEANFTNQTTGRGRKSKRVKVDDSGIRNQCRVNCGADVIIENVLPYLLPA